MRLAEPTLAPWKARLELGFAPRDDATILAHRRFEGPLVVQKAFHPEPGVCQAVVVHPPGGIAGGDELEIDVGVEPGAHALLTTPGAGKWYRSSGSMAAQRLRLRSAGVLEWLPRETIVFDGARAMLDCEVELERDGAYCGWEVLCLGRTGSGERFGSGSLRLATSVRRDGRLLFRERGMIDGGGAILDSRAGLGGMPVAGTLIATLDAPREMLAEVRAIVPATQLPGVLIARYLGDSSEEAFEAFAAAWAVLRPHYAGIAALRPRLWST
jgi:urease accessory protein